MGRRAPSSRKDSHEKVTKIYPLTRHNGKHFVPVKACLTCLGPSSSETFGSVSLPRRVILAEPEE